MAARAETLSAMSSMSTNGGGLGGSSVRAHPTVERTSLSIINDGTLSTEAMAFTASHPPSTIGAMHTSSSSSPTPTPSIGSSLAEGAIILTHHHSAQSGLVHLDTVVQRFRTCEQERAVILTGIDRLEQHLLATTEQLEAQAPTEELYSRKLALLGNENRRMQELLALSASNTGAAIFVLQAIGPVCD